MSHRRFNATQQLAKHRGRLQGTRRLRPDTERILNDVIDIWAAKAEHVPIAWILEECKRRTRTTRLGMPSRRAIDARLRDRGLNGLSRRQFVPKADAAVVLTLRSRKAPAIVKMDHTFVDIMVVDEVLRQSMGRPWITVAFDIATRVALGFALRLEPPSATSVGLALAMACLPKDQWLKDRHLDISWAPFGVPALVHADNGKEFHSLAGGPIELWRTDERRERIVVTRPSASMQSSNSGSLLSERKRV